MAEVMEPESGGEVDTAVGQISPSAAMAIGVRKGRREERPDPKFDAFLDRQTRLIDLQTEHLHEQRELILSRLRWGRFSDRAKALLQTMTIVVGAVAAGAVAVMAWQASQDRGVVIEAFSVPPDLAQRGLTGQVVASQLLDRLSDLQAQTVTGRPASTYSNDWGHDIRIEIPETGISIGELNGFLRNWLGQQTRISGEVVHTAAGVAVTARSTDSSGKRFEGAEADLDKLVGQAAEAIYARTQPYRYAVYLGAHGRTAEAQQALEGLVVSGPSEDRAWAYSSLSLLAFGQGRPEDARRLAETAIRLDPELGPAYQALSVSLISLGLQEPLLANNRASAAIMRSSKMIGIPKGQISIPFIEASEAELVGDYRRAIARLMAVHVGPDINTEGGRLVDARTNGLFIYALYLAEDHDLSGAQRVLPDHPELPMVQAALFEDWKAGAALADQMQPGAALPAAYALNLKARSLGRQAFRAEAYARAGRLADADAVIATLPVVCDHCLQARAMVAVVRGDWTAAQVWFGRWSRLSPSLPFADTAWGKALLERGDVQAAIAKLSEAHRRSPHFADPLELWGEALMRQGDFAGAIAKFTQADTDAPRWGRNHLLRGEALMLSSRYAQARAEYEAAAGMDLSTPDRAALNLLLARTARGPLHG